MLVFAELKFESILWHFNLLDGPKGKGLYCLFLATFYVNDQKDSLVFILNIIIFVLGICYICIGFCCKKKSLVVPVTTTPTA